MSSDDRDPLHQAISVPAWPKLGRAIPAQTQVDLGRVPEHGTDEHRDEGAPVLEAPAQLFAGRQEVPAFPTSAAPQLDALAPRSPDYATPSHDEGLLEAYRRFVIATTVAAISEHWDSGRIMRSRPDELPYLSEVRGLAGQRSGLATELRVEAEKSRGEAMNRVAAALEQLAPRLSPLHAICGEHGVGPIGAVVLLLVAAPALWAEVARLYGILTNDPGRPLCDEALLQQLLRTEASRRELGRELDAGSPLIRQGLVIAEQGRRPFQSLSPSPVVVGLVGGAAVEDIAEPGVRLVPCTIDLAEFAAPGGVIERALSDLAAAPAGRARVVVRGRAGSGRHTLLALLAHRAGRQLATFDAAPMILAGRSSVLRELLQRVHLRGWLPCLDGLDRIRPDDAMIWALVCESLRDHPGPLAIRLPHDAPVPVEPGHVRIDLPVLSVGERASQWSQAAVGVGLDLDNTDDLAGRFAVGPGTIRSVVATVARGGTGDPSPRIEAALRQYTETRFGALATRITRLPSWEQVVLPADVQDGVTELIARIRHRRTVYDRWGFDRVLTTSRGVTALFQGPSGTGKTLVASTLARELGLDLYRVDLSQVLSKWLGETQKNLAQLFDAAEEGQALLLFDEADALFGRRGNILTATDRYGNSEVDYLLQRLDTFEGVAVLTTNLEKAIDPAFHRRFTCRLTFSLPDEIARERLWRVHLPDELPRAELDLAGLARRYPMNGAAIRNAALRAAFLAAEERVPLSQLHLERVIRVERRDAGKTSDSDASG